MSPTVERQEFCDMRLYSHSQDLTDHAPRIRAMSLPTTLKQQENKCEKIKFISESSIVAFKDAMSVLKTEFDLATEEVATYDEKEIHSLNNWNWWEKTIQSHQNGGQEDSDDEEDFSREDSSDDSGDSVDVEDEFIFGSGSNKISRIHVQELIKHFDGREDFCNDEFVPEIEDPTRTNSCLKMSKNKSHKKFKSLRFADTLGQDLAHIKYFQDELPIIPLCAYKNLEGIDPNDFKSHPHYTKSLPILTPRPLPTPVPSLPIITHRPLPAPSLPSTTLIPMFSLPPISPLLSSPNQGVSLESLDPAGPSTMECVARVTNLHPEKLVVARWTTDGWKTHDNVEATFISGSGDGITELFRFQISPEKLSVGDQLEMCLRLEQAGQEFWDNNGGRNYTLQAFPNTTRRTVRTDVQTFNIENYL